MGSTDAAAELETERLLLVPSTAELRAAEAEGIDALVLALGCRPPATWPPPRVPAIATPAQGPGTQDYFWIEKASGQLIGRGGYVDLGSPRRAGLRFSVVPAQQRRGFASEALRRLASAAFDRGELRELCAEVLPGHVPALRALERAAFVLAQEAEDRILLVRRRVLRPWLVRALFPDHPRDFRGRRGLKILLRAGHVLAAGVLTGAWLLHVPETLRAPWLHATVLSGVVLLLLDLHESAIFLLQLRGLFVLLKILALLALPWLLGGQGLVLAALVVLSVVSSHAPSRVRYAIYALRGRFAPSRSKG